MCLFQLNTKGKIILLQWNHYTSVPELKSRKIVRFHAPSLRDRRDHDAHRTRQLTGLRNTANEERLICAASALKLSHAGLTEATQSKPASVSS